jgi:hypothetical protein
VNKRSTDCGSKRNDSRLQHTARTIVSPDKTIPYLVLSWSSTYSSVCSIAKLEWAALLHALRLMIPVSAGVNTLIIGMSALNELIMFPFMFKCLSGQDSTALPSLRFGISWRLSLKFRVCVWDGSSFHEKQHQALVNGRISIWEEITRNCPNYSAPCRSSAFSQRSWLKCGPTTGRGADCKAGERRGLMNSFCSCCWIEKVRSNNDCTCCEELSRHWKT